MAHSEARISINALLNPQTESDVQQRDRSHRPTEQDYFGPSFQPVRYHPAQTSPDYEDSALDRQSESDNTQRYRYERFDSVSSSSTNPAERRRPPRPKYDEEEMYFIWYHRVDLEEEWKEVQERFNRQFPRRGRAERNTQGIQCKFYRFIKYKNCPNVREQRRTKDGQFFARERARELPDYGVVQWCGLWFPWMKPEHATPGLRSADRSSFAEDKDKRLAYAASSAGPWSPETFTPQSSSDSTLSQMNS
jgi:hypothetical protein